MALTSQDFYKKSSIENYEDPPYVVFSLHNSQYLDEVWITFSEDCSEQFDNGWDVNKLFGDNTAQLFISEGEHKLSIDALPPLNYNERIVDLYFTTSKTGEYKLQLGELELLDEVDIYLEDKKTGIIQDMKKENSYVFDATPADDVDRFLVHFNPFITSDDEIESLSNCQIYAYNKTVYLKLDESFTNPQVEITDLLGREILTVKLKPASLHRISINSNNTYLIVRVTDEGQSTVKKIFIN